MKKNKVKSKDKKKNSQNKVRNKLIILSVLLVILPLISLGYLSYTKSFDILKTKLELTSQQLVYEVNNSIDEFLIGIENQVMILSENSSFGEFYEETINTINEESIVNNVNNKTAKELAYELLENVKESNGVIINTYLGTIDGGMYLYPVAELPGGFDPRVRPWYQLAVENKGKVVWTEPYVDANSGMVTITSSRTVVHNGKVIGVIGIDVDLKALSETLSKKTLGKNGYVFVTDNKGITIAHPDSKQIGKDTATKLSFWETAKSNKEGFETYEFEGDDKFLTFITNERTGWKIMGSLENRELLDDTDILRNYTVIVVILGALLGIIIASFIAFNISKPLSSLKEAFTKAATGDLTVETNITTKDEFGEIGQSFNTMISSIRGLIEEVKKSSYTVSESANSLNEITEQTAASTNEIAVTIEEIAKGAGEQARDTENGAIQVKDLATKIDMVEKSSNNMNEIVVETNNLTGKGLETVKLLTEKSKENKQSSDNVTKIVAEVDRNAQEISSITETISQIAEQTNLLALNAAIEAARAGEHGKGFAVVAEEVRKLAEESSNAATKVKELIDSIQNSSKTAVNSIEEAKIIADENDKAVEETKEIFSEISNSIERLIQNVNTVKDQTIVMTEKKNEIIGIIENLSASSEETSAATQQVSAAAEEQLATVEEVSSHAQNLKSLADKLQEAIGIFKIN